MRIYSKPVLCNYYLTYRCNASCSFCDIWEKPSPYVTSEDLEKNLLSLKKLGVKVIDFTGGEPLLHRNIDQFLSLAKKHGFITTITTNTLLYPKWAQKIKGLVDMLHFSLDYASKEAHDKARGVACYDSVMESIKLALSLGEKPDILFTVFNENIDQLEQVYQNTVLPNDLVLILNPVFTYNEEVGSNLLPKNLKILKAWGKRKNVYLNKAFIKLREEGGNQVKKPVCKAASSTIVISPENKLVLPCYHLGLEQFSLQDSSIETVLKKLEVKTIIAQEGKMEGCQGCAINCYMQPSFAVELNRFWWAALPSTLKYNRLKGTWKKLLFGSK